MNTFIQGAPVAMAANIISKYIAEKKGVWVNIQTPIPEKDEEKFIKAFNIACTHFDIKI